MKRIEILAYNLCMINRALYLYFVFVSVGLLASATAFGQTPAWHSLVKKDLQNLIKKERQNRASLGVWVGEVRGAQLVPIFEQNGSKLYVPASLSKLATALGALDRFSPNVVFETQVLAENSIVNGVLRGNLYLKGGGDPGFVSEKMWFLVNELRRTGIRAIQGDLIVDDSKFDTIRYTAGRTTSRVDRAYDAPIGALSFNWNSINVYVRPGLKVGDPARVIIDPENDYIQLDNRSITKNSGRSSISVRRMVSSTGVGDKIEVSGSIGMGAKEQVIYKNITQPEIWTGYNFKEFMRQRGIILRGAIRKGTTPNQARLLAKNESKPLRQMVSDMQKFSNNFVAETLTKNLAADFVSKPGTMARGIQLVNDSLQKYGLGKGQYMFKNASGLSTENKFTPAQLSRMLVEIRKRFTIYPEFLAALPIAGVDGTLKNRMKNTAAQRWVRAKTGLLNGVAGLGGYAGRSDGSQIVFVFIYNGNASISRIRKMFDKMAVILVDGGVS